jgi:hypothetical protein
MGWTPADLVIVVPMLGRPHRVAPLLASIDATTAGCRVLFCLTKGDTAVLREVDRHHRERMLFEPRARGDYAVKINTGARATDQPLIFTGADDLTFLDGWYEAATAELAPGIGVVGTNDLGSPRVMAGDHSTHSLVTREYMTRYGTIDEPGKIYHEGYLHEWVDDELIETAKYRGAFRMALGSHAEHLHWNWGKGPLDALYSQQQRRIRLGRPVFEQRRRLWRE